MNGNLRESQAKDPWVGGSKSSRSPPRNGVEGRNIGVGDSRYGSGGGRLEEHGEPRGLHPARGGMFQPRQADGRREEPMGRGGNFGDGRFKGPRGRGEEWRRDGGGRRGPPSNRLATPGAPLRGSAAREECFPRFRSFEEERFYVEERRVKRKNRPTLFDKEPSPEEKVRMEQMEQLLMSVGAVSTHALLGTLVGGSSVPSVVSPTTAAAVMPQQTRHARRLYVGNLPEIVDENEIHVFFRNCIDIATGKKEDFDPNMSIGGDEDPIISVYINRERLFAFVEFRTMEMTNSCMGLDGINFNDKGVIRVKRPNDYNPAIAPNPNICLPNFDVSKLGLVSGTVPDGPNKIFIGGLPYHLNESQIMELVSAFGTLRAFHLVKETPTSLTSKGYCFVEYVDPSNTPIAVTGLNGMDLGGGKAISARIAARTGEGSGYEMDDSLSSSAYGAIDGLIVPPSSLMMSAGATDGAVVSNTVDALLNAALGGMGTSPLSMAAHMGHNSDMSASYMNQAFSSALTSSNTRLDSSTRLGSSAVDGAMSSSTSAAIKDGHTISEGPSRVLVLMDMVVDEDLSSQENYQDLCDDVKTECEKYGKLLSMKIPRAQDGFPSNSTALRKIFLEYATVKDAVAANQQLSGRQFGPSVVKTMYFDESLYHSDSLQ